MFGFGMVRSSRLSYTGTDHSKTEFENVRFSNGVWFSKFGFLSPHCISILEFFSGMKSRDEIGKNIFDFEDDGGGGGGAGEVDEGWSRQSLAALEDNSHIVRQREREIQKIVQSILELNAIFKDLASMVSEQVNLFLS